MRRALLAVVALTSLPLGTHAADIPPFVIRVVDEQTGRGVPLVELRTTNEITYITDSAGVVAFDEPALLGEKVFFFVKSHGYEFPKDGFGMPGRALETRPGGSVELKIKRMNIAERLYRITGGGIYADSVRAELPTPIKHPLLNAQVLGQDSIQSVVLGGKIHWFWGDTSRPAYPLGLFHMAGATSSLPGQGGLDPSLGIDLEYFTGTDGFARATCDMAGEGPTWAGGLTVLTDPDGTERLFCSYAKIKGFLEAYRRGLAEWDPAKHAFIHVKDIPLDAPTRPDGHTFLHDENGTSYVYFCTPFPVTRVPATSSAWLDLDQYEAFSCLANGSTLKSPTVERDADGRPVWAWKRHTQPTAGAEEAELVKQGLLQPDETRFTLRDRDSDDPIIAHGGSVNWNNYLKQWILIAVQIGGKPSTLGEVWFARAAHPLGPWSTARRIVTHENYTFYNPKHHPFLDQGDGRLIYFEGTYSRMFSNAPAPTPRYDYNQIMYRLDLADPRL